MDEALLGLFPVTAEVKDNRLFVGGCDCVELAQEFGTPLYVYDEETLRESCRSFQREFNRRYPDNQVIYACKAFLVRPLVRLLMEEEMGLDVVSGGEMSVARAAGFPMGQAYFHGNNKSAQELALASELGVGKVVIDNFHELGLLEAEVQRRGRRQDVLIRFCPGVDPHTHAHTTTGAVDSKFGFAAEQWGTVAQALSRRMFGLLGFHFHLGSPVYEVEPYQEAIRIVLRFVKTLKKVKKEWELQELSVGGGFAVSYVRERLAPPVSYYAEGITKALIDGLKEHELPPPKLIIEPGRAVVGRAGVALYTVGARKDIPHVRTYIAVDGGLGDNIRPALYGARYEALVANRVEEEPKEMVTLAGRFCESGDVLVKDIPLPRTSPGDTVAIPAMGAYSIPMASNYNAAPRPAIVLVNKGKPVLWRRRESYEDLMAQDAG